MIDEIGELINTNKWFALLFFLGITIPMLILMFISLLNQLGWV